MKLDPAWIVAALAVAGAAVAVARYVWPILRKTDEFLTDWRGEDPRAGYPGRPGMPERIARLEGEFAPNHGGSLKDALNRVEAALAADRAELAAHMHDSTAHQPKETT